MAIGAVGRLLCCTAKPNEMLSCFATDWNDDLDQLCDAMPYMPACSLRTQCEVGGACLLPD